MNKLSNILNSLSRKFELHHDNIILSSMIVGANLCAYYCPCWDGKITNTGKILSASGCGLIGGFAFGGAAVLLPEIVPVIVVATPAIAYKTYVENTKIKTNDTNGTNVKTQVDKVLYND